MADVGMQNALKLGGLQQFASFEESIYGSRFQGFA
jgi:hypothetical protein